MIHSGRYRRRPDATPGRRPTTRPDAVQVYNHSGFVALLPYIEQDALFRLYNYGRGASDSTDDLTPTPPGDTVAAATTNLQRGRPAVKIYTCASDENPPPAVVPPDATTRSRSASRTTCSTPGIHDRGSARLRQPRLRRARAAATRACRRRPRGVRDGTGPTSAGMKDGSSNTIAIGEAKQTTPGPASYGPYWGVGSVGTGATLRGRDGHRTPRQPQIQRPRTPSPASLLGQRRARYCQVPGGFGSYHSGVTHFVFSRRVGPADLRRDQRQHFGFLLTADANDVVSGEY